MGQGSRLANRGPEMLLTFEPLLKIWGKMTERPLPLSRVPSRAV